MYVRTCAYCICYTWPLSLFLLNHCGALFKIMIIDHLTAQLFEFSGRPWFAILYFVWMRREDLTFLVVEYTYDFQDVVFRRIAILSPPYSSLSCPTLIALD
jgi:hypothetical protein